MRRMGVLMLIALLAAACSSNSAQTGAAGSSSPRAELPPGGGAPATASSTPAGSATHAPGVGGHPVKAHAKGHVTAVLNNGKIQICSLITSKQVNHIMHKTLPAPRPEPVGTFDECATAQRQAGSASASGIHVAWAVPPVSKPAAAFRQDTINLPASDSVHGLGSKAYCSTSQSSSQLFVLTGSRFLEVFAGSCGQATALAQIALSRL
jgi:hypothetical protein